MCKSHTYGMIGINHSTTSSFCDQGRSCYKQAVQNGREIRNFLLKFNVVIGQPKNLMNDDLNSTTSLILVVVLTVCLYYLPYRTVHQLSGDSSIFFTPTFKKKLQPQRVFIIERALQYLIE